MRWRCWTVRRRKQRKKCRIGAVCALPDALRLSGLRVGCGLCDAGCASLIRPTGWVRFVHCRMRSAYPAYGLGAVCALPDALRLSGLRVGCGLCIAGCASLIRPTGWVRFVGRIRRSRIRQSYSPHNARCVKPALPAVPLLALRLRSASLHFVTASPPQRRYPAR